MILLELPELRLAYRCGMKWTMGVKLVVETSTRENDRPTVPPPFHYRGLMMRQIRQLLEILLNLGDIIRTILDIIEFLKAIPRILRVLKKAMSRIFRLFKLRKSRIDTEMIMIKDHIMIKGLKQFTDFMVYGTPLYSVVQTLGRYGKGTFDLLLGFVLGSVADRSPHLKQLSDRLALLGTMELYEAFHEQKLGKGFAYITKEGLVKTDPEDTIQKIYKQKGNVVKEAKTGSVSGGFGMIKYVVVGNKRVYSFRAPYELPDAE